MSSQVLPHDGFGHRPRGGAVRTGRVGRLVAVGTAEQHPSEDEERHYNKEPLDHLDCLPQDRGLGGSSIIATIERNALRACSRSDHLALNSARQTASDPSEGSLEAPRRSGYRSTRYALIIWSPGCRAFGRRDREDRIRLRAGRASDRKAPKQHRPRGVRSTDSRPSTWRLSF